jgi:hypothetical protein
MSNTKDIKIIMDLVAADGSKEDLNKQRNILIEKTNDALQLFDYAIDNYDVWKDEYFGKTDDKKTTGNI